MYMKLTLPSSFEWVYVYVGKKSKEIGYIGRAKSAARLARRIIEHRSDEWYKSESWDARFYPCLNRYESETLETILINRYEPKWNKDKKGWGAPVFPSIDEPSIRDFAHVDEKTITIINLKAWLKDQEQKIKEEMKASGDWQD